jgi:hypothetical protein
MSDNRSIDASTAQTNPPNTLPEASDFPSSASPTAQTNEPVLAEKTTSLEATATVHELRNIPSAEINEIDIPVRASRTLVDDGSMLLEGSASQEGITADELQAKTRAFITSDVTAASHNTTSDESHSKGKTAAPDHRRDISSSSDFAYPPSAATRNGVAQCFGGPPSVHDGSESSHGRDLPNLTCTATNESFDSMGLTAVNTNDSSHSTRLTAVDSTSRNPPGAADGDVAPLSNADSIAALTTNWSSWSAAVDIFDDSKLWGKAEIVMEAAGGPTKLTSSVPVAQPRARPAPTSDIATQTENAPRPTLKLWFGEKARALELFCQRQARAYAAPWLPLFGAGLRFVKTVLEVIFILAFFIALVVMAILGSFAIAIVLEHTFP